MNRISNYIVASLIIAAVISVAHSIVKGERLDVKVSSVEDDIKEIKNDIKWISKKMGRQFSDDN